MSTWDDLAGTAERSTGPEFAPIPDDLYDAIVKDVSEPEARLNPFTNEDQTQFYVTWELTSGEVNEGTTIRQYITLPPSYLNEGYLNVKSNLFRCMEALGFDMEGQLTVDPRSWQGLEARVMVENKPNQQGEARPRVTGVKAKRPQQPQPARRQPVGAGAGRGPALRGRLDPEE